MHTHIKGGHKNSKMTLAVIRKTGMEQIQWYILP